MDKLWNNYSLELTARQSPARCSVFSIQLPEEVGEALSWDFWLKSAKWFPHLRVRKRSPRSLGTCTHWIIGRPGRRRRNRRKRTDFFLGMSIFLKNLSKTNDITLITNVNIL